MNKKEPTTKDTATTKLVVAWRQGNGFQFGAVKTSEKFQKRLRKITRDIDVSIGQRKRLDYSIGDEIETDEYMACPMATASRLASEVDSTTSAPARLKAGEAGRPKEPSAKPKEVAEFRRRLVTTMNEESPIGAKFLRENEKHPIVFYAIVRGEDPRTRTAYIRHLNPMRLMKRGAVIATLGDTLDDATHRIFAMDERADLVIGLTEITVLDKNFFESLFFDLSGEGAAMDAIVSETLNVLPFGSDALAMIVAASRARKRMRRKMLEIRQENQLESVTMDDFKRALGAEGIEESRFISKDGSIVSSEEDAELLLQILNDDLFHGILTGKAFSATRKSRRK
jgi:hypothetical protein